MTGALLLLLALPLAAQETAVEGKVVDSATGGPVSNARVLLRGLTLSGTPPEGDNYELGTDGNGRFAVKGVVPGKYEASAAREGYVARIPGRPIESGTVARLALSPGGSASITLKLIPAGVISGRIVNTSGDPVAGAAIEALQEVYPSNESIAPGTVWWSLPDAARRNLQPRGATNSDDRGEYRIFGLAPGRYRVRVVASGANYAYYPGFAIGQSITQMFASAEYPAPIDLAPGAESANIEVRVRPDVPHVVSGTLPGIQGRNANIQLQRRGDNSEQQPVYSTRFVDDRFSFDGVIPGSYVLTANLEEAFARQYVDVIDRDVDGVTLSLVPLKIIKGTVSGDGPLNFQLQNMNVELTPDNPETPVQSMRVSKDGAFSIGVLPEGYTLTRPRIPSAYFKSVKMAERELPDLHIDFARMEGPLTILLGTGGGKLTGVVKDAQGNPAPAARVTIFSAKPSEGWDGRTRYTNTDDDGKFDFPVVPPGAYRVFAWLDAELGATLDPAFHKKFEEQGVELQIEPRAAKAIELRGIVTR